MEVHAVAHSRIVAHAREVAVLLAAAVVRYRRYAVGGAVGRRPHNIGLAELFQHLLGVKLQNVLLQVDIGEPLVPVHR